MEKTLNFYVWEGMKKVLVDSLDCYDGIIIQLPNGAQLECQLKGEDGKTLRINSSGALSFRPNSGNSMDIIAEK